MAEPTEPRFALDEETIERGRREIAAIRARLRHGHDDAVEANEPRLEDSGEQPPEEDAPAPRSDLERRTVEADVFGDRMAAEMAAGAERDRLAARVAQLEAEVAQLRGAIADILRTAAGAVSAEAPTPAHTATVEPTVDDEPAG